MNDSWKYFTGVDCRTGNTLEIWLEGVNGSTRLTDDSCCPVCGSKRLEVKKRFVSETSDHGYYYAVCNGCQTTYENDTIEENKATLSFK